MTFTERKTTYLVKGKPSYTSEHEDGAYAVWFDDFDDNRNYWCIGPSSSRGKKEWKCCFYAPGKGDDIYPTDTGYSFSECLIFYLDFLMIYIDLHRFYKKWFIERIFCRIMLFINHKKI